MNDPEDEQREDGVLAAGIVLGVGFAALFDGVVFHQVLQWHHMVSAWHPPDTVENMELNTTADGWFHVAASLIVVAGVGMLWRATARAGRRPRTGVVVGGGLMGAGGFNVGEGIIDHVLLGVHHVREGSSSGTYARPISSCRSPCWQSVWQKRNGLSVTARCNGRHWLTVKGMPRRGTTAAVSCHGEAG